MTTIKITNTRKPYDQKVSQSLVEQVNERIDCLTKLNGAWDVLVAGDRHDRENTFVLAFLEEKMGDLRADATQTMIALHRSWMTWDEAWADSQFYIYTDSSGDLRGLPVQAMYGPLMCDSEDDPAPISGRLAQFDPMWNLMSEFRREFPLT